MRTNIAHMTFSDAVLNRSCSDKDISDVIDTGVRLPQWMLECTAILRIQNKMSEGKLFTRMVNHGTCIIENKYLDLVGDIGETRVKMINSDNVFIKDVAMKFTFDVDGLGGGGIRRTVRVPTWCKNVLGSFSGDGMMNYSSMVRLAIAFSLSRHAFLKEERLRQAIEHSGSFDKKFRDYIEFCDRLTTPKYP